MPRGLRICVLAAWLVVTFAYGDCSELLPAVLNSPLQNIQSDENLSFFGVRTNGGPVYFFDVSSNIR